MKKKQALALMLAVAMASATSMTAMAEDPSSGEEEPETVEDHNPAGDTHGDRDNALVSDQNPFNWEDDSTYQGDTQFYLRVDKDATNGTVSIVTSSTVSGSDGACHYIIDWNTERKANLSVTVPLYVCMYGYGGDGSVVVPGETAYAMKNSSKYSEKTTVKAIEACYLVNRIDTYDEYYEKAYQASIDQTIKDNDAYTTKDDISTDVLEQIANELVEELPEKYQEYLESIGSPSTAQVNSGDYGYYIDASGNKTVISYSDVNCSKHSEADGCNGNVDNYYYKVSTDSITDGDGKQYIVAETYKDEKNGDLDVNVPTIEVETATWEIGSADAIQELQKEQIAMTINDLDLFQVYRSDDQKLDIKDLGWVIPGKGSLKLPITAAIAGGSVNDDVNCVPVVRVIYTVAPAYDRTTPTPSAN